MEYLNCFFIISKPAIKQAYYGIKKKVIQFGILGGINITDNIETIDDIRDISGYLALYICIKGYVKKEKNRKYTKEELRALPRHYPYPADALKMFGMDVKEHKKRGI